MTFKHDPKPQSGFGLLETLVGLLVFVILIFVGTKAFKNIVSNHTKAAQLKTLTDAVANTSDRLANLSVTTLTDPKGGYTTWSSPQEVGLGDYVYQFRIVPKPNIAGVSDSTLVGLEVQSGTLVQGVFKMERSFATLFAPNFSTKDGLGKSVSLSEREAEATFYASLRKKLADVAKAVPPENQNLLNSYSCYNPGECCGFMQEYFANPSLAPTDGIKEKCLYRCALSGNVGIMGWQNACKANFCADAPWKSSADCCKAIAAGQCPNGSICASVCVECVHEDGSNCGTSSPSVCETEDEFGKFFDCNAMTYCDGTALPDGIIPGWGDVKALCQTQVCKNVKNECGILTTKACCDSYWEDLARGDIPREHFNVCATISKKSDCCDIDIDRGTFDFKCTTSGTVAASNYKGTWYCDDSPFKSTMDRYCVLYKGCSGSYGGSNKSGVGGCAIWKGPLSDGPTDDPYVSSGSSTSSGSSNTGSKTSSTPSTTTKPVLSAPGKVTRVPANRGGTPISGGGGQE